jgi:hypothetical protein
MAIALSSPLDSEAAIVERLRTKLAGTEPAVHVLTAADLAGVTEEKQLTPAVHVIYRGYRVLQARADGSVAKVAITWLAVTATRNVRGLASGASARVDAAALFARVFKALGGFMPPGATTPMRAATPPLAGFSAGLQYVPAAFEFEASISSDNPNFTTP